MFLSGESHGQRSLAGCSPWGRKESDTTERLTLSQAVYDDHHLYYGHCFVSLLNEAEKAFTEAMKFQILPSTLLMGSVALGRNGGLNLPITGHLSSCVSTS